MTELIRWHWKMVDQSRGEPLEYDFLLDYLPVPENPDRFPYVQGHALSLHYRDPMYPVELGRLIKREKFLTEELRSSVPVVSAHGVLGIPFWSEQVSDNVMIHVALATPDARFNDNPDMNPAFRVYYEKNGQRWYVAPVDPAVGGLSKIPATEIIE